MKTRPSNFCWIRDHDVLVNLGVSASPSRDQECALWPGRREESRRRGKKAGSSWWEMVVSVRG